MGPPRRDSCRTRKTGRQTWSELLFVHWEVPAALLRRLVPPGLTIDTFEGRAYLGLVPFNMRDVQLGPIPVADFLETNLRTYVHAEGVPGVWFFSLDAQSALAVWGARTFYRLPYFRARMESVGKAHTGEYRLQRHGPRDVNLEVRWAVLDSQTHTAECGTLEHFLTERYALYGPSLGQGLYRVRVHHAPWPLQSARLTRLVTCLPQAAGMNVGEPIELTLASPQGVAVETFARERVKL